jgi:hypothetical protein
MKSKILRIQIHRQEYEIENETNATAPRFVIRYGVALQYLSVVYQNRLYIQSPPNNEIQ